MNRDWRVIKKITFLVWWVVGFNLLCLVEDIRLLTDEFIPINRQYCQNYWPALWPDRSFSFGLTFATDCSFSRRFWRSRGFSFSILFFFNSIFLRQRRKVPKSNLHKGWLCWTTVELSVLKPSDSFWLCQCVAKDWHFGRTLTSVGRQVIRH